MFVEAGLYDVPDGLLVDSKDLDFVVGTCDVAVPGLRVTVDFGGAIHHGEVQDATVTIAGFDLTNAAHTGTSDSRGILELVDATSLFSNPAHVTLADVTVNDGEMHNAGCVYVGDGTILEVLDSTIGPNCSADTWAGAIEVRGGQLHLMGTTLVSATGAARGGVIRVWQGGLDSIDPTLVFGTLNLMDAAEVTGGVADAGGCIVAEGDSIVTLADGSSIHDCTATGECGGVQLLGGTLSVADGAAIRDNTSSGNGAGVYAAPGTTVAFAGSSSLTGNIANGGGGGMCLDGGTASFADSADITDNHADLGGGGIDVIGAGALDLSGDVLVELNDAGGDGGAIRVGEGVLVLADRVTLSDNQALGGNGGAIALGVAGLSTLITRGEPFSDPIAPSADATGFASGGVRLTLNRASAAGGAIWVGASGQIGLPAAPGVPAERSRFAILADNDAGMQGGGLYVDAGSTARAENMRIAANVSPEAAGVFVGQGATFDLASRQTGGLGFACVVDPGAFPNWADRSCAEISDNLASSGTGGLSIAAGALTTLSRVRLSGNGGGPASAAHLLVAGDGVVSADNVAFHDALFGAYSVLVQDVGTFSARHVTFADPGIDAVWEDASVGTLTDTVFWGTPVGGLRIWGMAAVRGRCNAGHGDIDLITWAGGGPSLNADEENPLFVTNAWGRFHLDHLSPSADKCPTGAAIDLDGRVRPLNVKALPMAYHDRGAFEAFE